MPLNSVSSDMDADLPDLALGSEDILEEDADLSNLAQQSAQAFAPPPHIAARFYRPAPNRRKSSATSSRRNSISSSHSHQSNASYHGGCQSNHVAQQLRRASILESRKARLADRAAHAEQVRLRAAIAKATPKASNTEERAMAARQARERHLAQVAAACAEEVRRAKKIAEDMKERKAAEERRYRLEMEERHAEAERRRLEYKRNVRRPRTTSVPSPENKKPSAKDAHALAPDVAARRIQTAWRRRERKKVIEKFIDLGLSIDKVHETSFEKIGALLSEDDVINCTSKLLRLLGLRGTEKDSTERSATVRTFLSAYLILGHPASVLSRDGDQEQDLIQKAKDLIICFESTLAKISETTGYSSNVTQRETLLMAHSAFVAVFSDWKARDSSALIETMVASFVHLDAIWQSVKDYTEGEVANDYREGIRDNQVILLSKIRKLAGPDRANALIKRAIRESRRGKAKRKPIGDVRPRPIAESLPPSPSGQLSLSGTATSPNLDSQIMGTLNPGAITTNEESKSQAVSSDKNEIQDSELDESTTAALAKIFTVLPSNRVLTHEIAIDKDYRIDTSPHSETRDAFNRQICESMQKGFENGEGDKWTVAMAKFIRIKLLKLLREGNSMHTLISEALDPTHIQQQCAQGAFSYARFFAFMASILPKLCAPIRDEQVKVLVEELQLDGNLSDMIERLFKLLHVIDLLNLDYSNFMLMQAIPILLKNSELYESQIFAQDLESGTITLQKTKRWWSNACVNVITEADNNEPAQRQTFQRIYARGLTDLAVATTPLQTGDLPETLDLDKARITKMRRDTVRITAIGAILLSAKNLLKRDVRTSWKAESSRVWDIIKDDESFVDGTTPGKIISIIESSHALPPSTRAQLTSTATRLLSQANSGRFTDPVAKVLFQRLRTHVFNRVSASSSKERVKAASTATERLATTGLPEFSAQVGDMVELLGKISEVDRKAHGTWYEQVAKEVEAAGDHDQSST